MNRRGGGQPVSKESRAHRDCTNRTRSTTSDVAADGLYAINRSRRADKFGPKTCAKRSKTCFADFFLFLNFFTTNNILLIKLPVCAFPAPRGAMVENLRPAAGH